MLTLTGTQNLGLTLNLDITLDVILIQTVFYFNPCTNYTNCAALSKRPTTGWPPNSKKELQATIGQCLELSPTDCFKGPHGPIGSWDVSAVTDMSLLFNYKLVPGANEFTGDISKWDVSSVTDMQQISVMISARI